MLTPNTVLQNRYRIIRQLGKGGMGTVYEAIDLRFDSQVAIKESHFSQEVLRKQFEREARLLNKMRHLAMTRVIDHFTEDDGQFLVMDYIAGDDLAQMLKHQGDPFAPERVLVWADQLLDVLDYLHRQDPPIIHRDIKPQNLKLSDTGQIILLDFGLAKGFDAKSSGMTTQSGSIFGYTPSYAPLEQIEGTGTVPSSDLYSLAATLYHLMTGERPPDALRRASAKVNEQPDPLIDANEVTPQVRPQIAEVLKKAMALNSSKRFASAPEMRAALRRTSEIDLNTDYESSARSLFNAAQNDTAPTPKIGFGNNAQNLPQSEIGIEAPQVRTQPPPADVVSGKLIASPTRIVTSPQPEESPSRNLPLNVTTVHPKSRSRWRVFAVLGAIVMVGVIVFAFSYFRKRNTPAVESSEYYGAIKPPPGQKLRYIAGYDPQTLDPQVLNATSDSKIAVALFDGLVEYDEATANPRPSLAKSWDINSDATIWIFHLRNDAKWSDGNPITAHDFVYSWRRALSPELASVNAILLYYIKNGQPYNEGRAKTDDVGVRAIDDYTFEVTLERPAAYFIKLLLNPSYRPVPRQSIQKWGDKLWATSKNIVTSGAFTLTEWTPSQRIVVDRNPQFWDNAQTKLDQIIFTLLSVNSDADAALEVYRAGEIDAMSSGLISLQVKQQVKDKKDYFSVPAFNMEFLTVNTTVEPLNDNRVRRVLSMAINRQKFGDLLSNRIPITGFVPLIVGYDVAKGADYQPDEARRLLAEAGFPGGHGFPEIELLFNESSSNRQAMEMVQSMLQSELGIKVTLVSQEWKAFFKTRKALKYRGLARAIWVGDFADPTSFFGIFSTPDGANLTGWYDPKYIQLLTVANAEIDPYRRSALLHEVEAYLLKQQPVIPLFIGMISFMRKPYVKNLEPNLLDQHDWRRVSIDHSMTE